MRVPTQSQPVDRTLFYMTRQHYKNLDSLAPTNGAIFPAQCAPIGGFREEAMIRCMNRCRSRGGTQSGCRTTCCQEVTGYSCCYFS